MTPLRIVAVVGARPNFIKIAPITKRITRQADRFAYTLVHTGQHYDEMMSQVFFDDLNIPRPTVSLGVGSASQALQTARIMEAFEPVVTAIQPDLVIVVGDVNSTVACSLVAAKLGVAVAHVEAGLRSFDRGMPEEINRVVTDHLSELLFITEPSAAANLNHEGIPSEKVHFVGNVMIDTLLQHRERARQLQMPSRLGLAEGAYAVLTLHRPTNVDDQVTFNALMRAVLEISRECPVVFPVHPRTRGMVASSGVAADMIASRRLITLDPLGYLEFLSIMESSVAVLTDSGGIQEETTILGVPCLTLRTTTERPVTVTEGTNRVVGTDTDAIIQGWRQVRSGTIRGRMPALWDGQAAERIVQVLKGWRPSQ